MKRIYIIIVTYNAMKWAERCFSSLRKSSISVKTIVVDNGSTDGTQEYVKTNFPEVHFIQSPENLGFGKANNIGIEVAYKEGADFFYLMNQDAWLFQDSIQELLNVYNSYEDKEEIGITVAYDDVEGWINAIHRIADHPEEAQKMGANARKLAEKRFNLEIFSREIAESLLEISKMSPKKRTFA